MKAVLCRQWGDPQSLEVAEIPEPTTLPADGVRIRVMAAGVNFADLLMISGKYQEKPPFPFSPGLEVAGEVIAAGPHAEDFKPGDRVMALLDHGGYAEECVARASDVHAVPDSMDFATAAGFPIVYGTSHVALKYRAALREGETLLVHAAASGVGLTALEIGRILGARVIATAGGPEKLAVAAARGADHLIDYRREDIRQKVKTITQGRGADVVYDPVGGAVFDASLRAVAPMARLLVIGFAGGTVPQIPANLLLVKNLSVLGLYWGALRQLDPGLLRRSFAELLQWYAEGRLKPQIGLTLPLLRAPEALQALKGRQVAGKVVLLAPGVEK